MKVLLKLLLTLVIVSVLAFTGLIAHFIYLDFAPEEINRAAVSYAVSTLITDPESFFEMYRFDLDNLNAPEQDDSAFSGNGLKEGILERVSTEGVVSTDNNGKGIFRGDVMMVDSDLGALGLRVNDSPTLTQNEIIYSSVSCENTSIFSRENYTFIKNTANLFNEIEVGDVFEARCENEDCSNLIGECILIKL